MTDKYTVYQGLDEEFAGHEIVDHGKGEYVRSSQFSKMYWNVLECTIFF
jgi:hypothetical protein